MRSTLVGLLVAPLLASGALTFAGGATEETATTTTATAATGACERVLVGGNYTWCTNWLEAPTASELGIGQFNESPILAALVRSGELPPVEEERLPNDPLVSPLSTRWESTAARCAWPVPAPATTVICCAAPRGGCSERIQAPAR